MTYRSEYNPIIIPGFGGGINQELPANEIADDECVDILNFDYDQDSNLIVSPGVTKDNDTPSVFPGRITSMYFAQLASGVGHLIITAGSEIYYRSSAGVYTSIKGAATLPTDVFYSFAVLDDKVVGCNSAATGSGQLNPFKWTGSGNIAQLADGGGNAPRFKFVCVWNNRLFGVDADEPNVIHFSALGDPENYTVDGGSIEVGADDGDLITAIHSHKGRLFVFKRRHTYVVVPGTPNTDPDEWSIEQLIGSVGCATFVSTGSVLDDLLYFTDNGLTSSQIAQETGGFTTNLLSRKIPSLSGITVNSTNLLAAAVFPSRNQYWLAVPTSLTPSDNGVLWKLDFKRIREGVVRWLRADGKMVGSSYCVVNFDGQEQMYICGTDSDRNIYRYADEDEYSHAGEEYTKYIETKAYSRVFEGGPEDLLMKKEFNRFGFAFTNYTANTTLTVAFRFDQNSAKGKSYAITLAETLEGSLWDIDLWDEGTFADFISGDYEFERTFVGDPGRFGRTIQFLFSASTKDQKWLLKEMFYEAKTASRRGVATI